MISSSLPSVNNEEDIKPISPSMLTLGRELEILGKYTGQDVDLQEMYNHRSKNLENFLKTCPDKFLKHVLIFLKDVPKNVIKFSRFVFDYFCLIIFSQENSRTFSGTPFKHIFRSFSVNFQDRCPGISRTFFGSFFRTPL